MDEIIKEIQNLNSENYQKFISKYGMVQNEELAKEFLILNPNAWNILSEDLKQMGEVVAHYIPVGYYVDDISVDMCGCDSTSTGIYYPDTGDVYLPVGFKYIKGCVYPNILSVPNIDFPSDLSEEQYLEILKNIPVKENSCFSNLDADVVDKRYEDKLQNCEMYSVFGNTPKSIENAKEIKLAGFGPDRIDRRSIVFDRSKIKEVVANLYSNKKLKKR